MEDLPLETCFLVASLGLNVAALAPLSGSIYFNMSLTKAWYGEPTVARSILVSVYMSTVVASLCLICLLFLPNALYRSIGRHLSAGLLLFQILQSFLTPFTELEGFQGRALRPLACHLGMATFHGITLGVMFFSGSLDPVQL
ncbi:unnamed protein product [Durusdinium trenchii]|uniref:Uncharacterized protein n=1 Tax=Durusdinium trenchii TaxID=1381693 RepID=A0ABP0QI00_9DINO